MNIEEILNNSTLNGRKDRVVRESSSVVISPDGEVLSQNNARDIMIDKEPPYIKVYIDSLCIFNGISIALSPILLAFSRHMTFANNDSPNFRHIVRTDAMTRQDVAQRCNISDSRVKQAIKELVTAEAFIPIKKVDGKIRRGVYYVNPWMIAKGEWADIKKLRGEFEFISGAIGVCAEKEDGTRQVLMPVTTKPVKRPELSVINLAEKKAK